MVDLFVLFLKSPGRDRGFCLEVKEKWENWQGKTGSEIGISFRISVI
jgi:hypothetical protein